MNKFNYILNDIAFDTYVIKCLYGEPTDEDLRICENQIKLLQQENKQLLTNWNELYKYIDSFMEDYLFKETILEKMQELEKSDNNE